MQKNLKCQHHMLEVATECTSSTLCEISGFHSSADSRPDFLGCDAM